MSTQETEWLKDAKETVACTFTAFDFFDLVDRVSVTFNDRFTGRAGDANYGKMRIRLSTPLWPRMTEQDRYTTIVHEACHIIVRHERQLKGWSPYFGVTAHGIEWKQAMRKCGLNPTRCHKIDRTGIHRVTRRTTAYCNCDIPHEITLNMATRIRNGSVYFCGRCRGFLSISKDKNESIVRFRNMTTNQRGARL